ncbi:unnamed protein product [Rotaria magnacalcarata]|uniref:Caseinolytic peptidase B protein homolog n=4 Tax=Rotaria magnacalcarata TaxID=392030 RepID=A0A817AF22_9BILA|nr:unnamed protein product [Rotaria magnacalcarata]CAF2262882.1 unnamed protein product [Rotaria magnacalcarata]
MVSRYLFRTFRRLLLFSSSHLPLSFRNNRLLWTSLGTATVLSTAIYKSASFEKITRSFIVYAKGAEKDLSHNEKQLFQAARDGQLQALQQLIEQEKLDVNLRHPLGWTPLLVAVINDRIDCVKYLLSKGADPNQSDEFTNVQSMAKKLHWNPVNVYTKREEEFCNRLSARATFNGFTALHYAVLNDNISIINILIEYGADPLIENEQGHLPSAYALQQRKELLSQYEQNAKKLHEERMKGERRRRPLELRIKENIVGQNYAISTVCAAIRRKQSGWTSDESPLVFLFLGSSGVGKTELAKQIAKYLNGEKNQTRCFIRIDMSEYQEKHEVSKLIGAPPGYEKGGQLTDALKKCPTAVVLFDEVDKAHPDVLTVMLQLFDEGRLTDGKGKTIDGRQAIYVMTSNLASEEIANYAQDLRREEEKKPPLVNGGPTSDDTTNQQQDDDGKNRITVSKQFKDKVVKPILKKHFRRDEFLGRINEMVYFLPFSQSEINKLLLKELEFWKNRAIDQHNIDIIWDRKALDCLADGYDINYGARSLKHEIERSVVNQLAAAHEQGLIESGNQILLTAQENIFHTPFTNGTKHESVTRSVKLQKVETIGGRSLISGFFNSGNTNSQTANVIYTDIKPEDHLKTYQF